MKQRRRVPGPGRGFSDGPGKVAQALGIHYSHSGMDITVIDAESGKPAIWIEDAGRVIPPGEIIVTTRIGVGYAGDDAHLPYRFILKKM